MNTMSMNSDLNHEKAGYLDQGDNSPTAQISCYLVPSFDDFDIAEYRKSLGMSQPQFAKEHDISLGTLRKWERHSSEPIFGAAMKKILHGWVNYKLSFSGTESST